MVHIHTNDIYAAQGATAVEETRQARGCYTHHEHGDLGEDSGEGDGNA